MLITAETKGLKKAVKDVQSELSGLDKKVNSTTKSINNAFGGMGKSIKNALGSIAKVAGISVGIAALVKLGKQAVATASDLEEIQNVVDVAFGNSAQEINEWAKTCLKSFGLTQAQAKDTASTFKSMANGLGLDDTAAKNMSTTLTGLAADLSSFRNTTLDMSKTALAGVFTGETEALKKYGVVMTEANLKAYAMSQGIKKNYADMSQAEKVALRYAYVMQATADAQGDFSRSSKSWANQIRVLKGQWEEFMGVIGTLVKQILTPLVGILNQVLEKVINITKAVMTALGINVDFSSPVDDAAESTNDLADNMEQATDDAKKLKKQLMGFDDLNVLQDNSSSKDDNKADAGIDNLWAKIMDINTSDGVNKIGEAVDKMVDGIVEKITKAIDIIKQKLKEFRDKFRDYVPKLNLDIDWGRIAAALSSLGNTVWNAISSIALEAAKLFVDVWNSIDWTELTVNLLGALEDIAHIIQTVVVGAIQLLGKVLKDIQFGAIVNKVGEVVKSFTNLVKVIVDILVPAFQTFYDKAISPIVKWIGEQLLKVLDKAKAHFDDWAKWFTEHGPQIQAFFEVLGQAFNTVWSIIQPILTKLVDAIMQAWDWLHEKLKDVLEWILDHAEIVSAAIVGVVTAFMAFKTVTFVTTLVSGLVEGIGALIGSLTLLAANPVALVVAAIAGLVAAFAVLWHNCEGFRNFWIGLWQTITQTIQSAVQAISNFINGIMTAISNVVNSIKELLGLGSSKQSRGGGFGATGGFGGNATRKAMRQSAPTALPQLAKGGVLTQSTIVEAGEYAGAKHNPEIVAPESKIKEVMTEANEPYFNLILGAIAQVSKSIESKDTNVYIDKTKITRQITKEQTRQNSDRGSSLVTA